MFFSTELLSKRDSGYGLLWLAATLGSKSNLKSLPRRSVLTANIVQLCSLISEPPEPLALRLSSNLMVGVVRVFKMKQEIFETDVGNCVTSLKKALQDLRTIDRACLEMAQPNGLREDVLNLVVDPAMAMAAEFDGIIDDWDMIFRRIGEEQVLGDDEEFESFLSARPGDPSPQSRHQPNKKLHQLDESHDHLFSNSFLNSLSGDIVDASSSAHMNGVLFDLDFGDPDVGFGEEMERDLEEAWNMKANSQDAPPPAAGNFDFESIPMDVNGGFGDIGDGGMDFLDDPFGPGIEPGPGIENEVDIAENSKAVDPTWLSEKHTPPSHDQLPSRSILFHRAVDDENENQIGSNGPELSQNEEQVQKPRKRPRKRVMLLDPKTELPDDILKFHKNNYLKEMKRLRREAQDKKEQKEGRRRIEEAILAPPNYFVAPELVELWDQWVTYPVKTREAAWRKELDELELPVKKRRVHEKVPSARVEEHMVELDSRPARDRNGFDFGIHMEVDNIGGGDFDGNYGGMEAFDAPIQLDLQSGSRRSSDEPGQPRRPSSHPPSLPGSSFLGRGAFDASQGEPLSNSIFPWDNAGPSPSNVAFPDSASLPAGSGSGSDFGPSFDSGTVRFRRSSRGNSGRDSPAIFLHSEAEAGDAEMVNDVGLETRGASVDLNPGETQESEGIITLEKNSFNFLGYAKMHMASDSGPLFFSDIAPIESSSTRIAAEAFYHCLALATKDLIRLEQSEPYGPIKIVMK